MKDLKRDGTAAAAALVAFGTVLAIAGAIAGAFIPEPAPFRGLDAAGELCTCPFGCDRHPRAAKCDLCGGPPNAPISGCLGQECSRKEFHAPYFQASANSGYRQSEHADRAAAQESAGETTGQPRFRLELSKVRGKIIVWRGNMCLGGIDATAADALIVGLADAVSQLRAKQA